MNKNNILFSTGVLLVSLLCAPPLTAGKNKGKFPKHNPDPASTTSSTSTGYHSSLRAALGEGTSGNAHSINDPSFDEDALLNTFRGNHNRQTPHQRSMQQMLDENQAVLAEFIRSQAACKRALEIAPDEATKERLEQTKTEGEQHFYENYLDVILVNTRALLLSSPPDEDSHSNEQTQSEAEELIRQAQSQLMQNDETQEKETEKPSSN